MAITRWQNSSVSSWSSMVGVKALPGDGEGAGAGATRRRTAHDNG